MSDKVSLCSPFRPDPGGCIADLLLVGEAAGLHHALGLFVDVVIQVGCGKVRLITGFH